MDIIHNKFVSIGALIGKLKEKYSYGKVFIDFDSIMRTVGEVPTTDVMKVRYGAWVYGEYGLPHCSWCCYEPEIPWNISPFCPRCGAVMGVDENMDMTDEVFDGEAQPETRGHWEIAIGYDPKKKVQCSNCGLMNYEPTDFCPHCGCRMGGGDGE